MSEALQLIVAEESPSENEELNKKTDPILDWFLSHCHLHKYPAKTTLTHTGDPATTLYMVVSGKVMVSAKDKNEKEVILTYLGEGEFFGESGLFDEGATRSAWVKTKTDCEIAEISYVKYRQLVQMNPEILMLLTSQIFHRLQNTSSQVYDLAFLDVSGRVAKILLNLAREPEAMTHPEGMQIKITRQEIGQLVGCSRETVGRIIQMLEHDELIRAHGKTIVVYGTR